MVHGIQEWFMDVHGMLMYNKFVLENANVLTTFKLIKAPMVGSSAPNLDCRPVDPLAGTETVKQDKQI